MLKHQFHIVYLTQQQGGAVHWGYFVDGRAHAGDHLQTVRHTHQGLDKKVIDVRGQEETLRRKYANAIKSIFFIRRCIVGTRNTENTVVPSGRR